MKHNVVQFSNNLKLAPTNIQHSRQTRAATGGETGSSNENIENGGLKAEIKVVHERKEYYKNFGHSTKQNIAPNCEKDKFTSLVTKLRKHFTRKGDPWCEV